MAAAEAEALVALAALIATAAAVAIVKRTVDGLVALVVVHVVRLAHLRLAAAVGTPFVDQHAAVVTHTSPAIEGLRGATTDIEGH